MKPTTVNHSLRTIQLAYKDNDSPLCPYEEKLIGDYISMQNKQTNNLITLPEAGKI